MTFEVGLGLVFGLGWLPLFVFRVESLRAALPSYAGLERVCVQLTPVLLAIHMTVACLTINLTPRVSRWAACAGLLTFAAAIAFWFWGRLMIGPLRAQRLPEEPPRQLCRHGAFGIVRHPLYCSYMVAAGAPLIVVPRAVLLITYVPCVLALAARAVQEEGRLRMQLGPAYDAYCRQVKRLIPFVW